MALAKHAEEISEKVLENLQKMKQKETEKAHEKTADTLNPARQVQIFHGVYGW